MWALLTHYWFLLPEVNRPKCINTQLCLWGHATWTHWAPTTSAYAELRSAVLGAGQTRWSFPLIPGASLFCGQFKQAQRYLLRDRERGKAPGSSILLPYTQPPQGWNRRPEEGRWLEKFSLPGDWEAKALGTRLTTEKLSQLSAIRGDLGV